jgi:lipopolysaccharide transport system ATP-binding protein
MAEPGILFDGVWKKFNRSQRFNSLRDLIPELASVLFRGREEDDLEDKEFWALQDVSFEVKPGQALGIIGPNGAGKSTALKILTKILRPDRGRSEVRGRVGALVEIAAGFHPDLTGRENVFMQGAIMGMKRADVLRKFDDIIEFSGVAEFIDTPVKRYSSGMNARLGFAVAAHLDPDVLLIDEVLSVGDLSFQEKCFDRMQQFVRSGIPMVFVSHNLSAISNLCDRVLVLRGGQVVTLAPTQEAIAAYATLAQQTHQDGDRREITLSILDADGRHLAEVDAGDPLVIRVAASLRAAAPRVQLELQVRHLQSGQLIYRIESGRAGASLVDLPADGRLEADWSLVANLGRGHYSFTAAVLNERGGWLARSSPALLAVREDQSVRATVFLDARCQVRVGPGAMDASEVAV